MPGLGIIHDEYIREGFLPRRYDFPSVYSTHVIERSL